MALMTWNDSYSVGVPSIDDQHKKLMDMLNNLFEAMQGGKGKEALGKIMDELISYTSDHFAYEENIFAKTAYSNAISHKGEHESLKQKVVDINERYKRAQTGALSLEVVNFLKSWLTNHILGTDMKYAQHMVEKGIK